MTVISNRLSRWTLLFFACALVNFVAAQGLIVAGATYPVQSWAAPGTLIAVHLLVIGWLLLLMLGALFQFVPVMTSKLLPSQNLALATLVSVQLGLVGMSCGFAGASGGLPFLAHCLPIGGALVIVGILIAIYDIGVPLLQARPLPLPGRMVLTALVFLLATVTLGMLMALALTTPSLGAYFAPLLGYGVGYHALAGLGGWFTIAAIGVSYKLLPMFMLSPEERGWPGELVHWLAAAGFALVVVAGVVRIWRPAPYALTLAGYALALVAVAIYLADVVRIYRTRKRSAIELQNTAATGAFVLLAVAALAAAILAATGTFAVAAPLLVFIVLFGWLGGLGLTQLYKIVPFLTWIGRFGSRLGRGRVPRVQDLVDEKRASPWFVIYFLGAGLGALALFGRDAGFFRVSMALIVAATLMLAFEYWRAWRGYYERNRAAAPPTPPFMNKETLSDDRG